MKNVLETDNDAATGKVAVGELRSPGPEDLVETSALALQEICPNFDKDIEGFILENCNWAVTLVRDRHFVWANRRMGELFAMPLEMILGASTRVIYASDEIYETSGRRGYCKEGGADFTVQCKRGDGSLFWCRLAGKNLNPDLPHAGTILVFEDVTERKEIEAKLQLQTSALQAAANGVLITDCAGRILWANPAFVRLTGYSVEEAVGKTASLLKSGKHHQLFYENLWNTISRGDTWTGELINRRRDGSLYSEEMTITPVRNEQGQIQNFVAIKQDITQRKEFEQALAYERDLLQSLMDNLPDYIYFKDRNSRFTRINLAHARHLGVPSPKEVVGKSDADFFPDQAARQKLVDELRIIATGEPVVGLIEQSDSAIGSSWVSTTKVPLRDAAGRITGLVGVSRDISEFKRAEELVRQSEARYHSLFDNMLEGFARCRMLFDQGRPVDFVFVEVNPAFGKLTGLADVVGKKASNVVAGLGRLSSELLEACGRVTLTGKAERLETYLASLKIWLALSIYSSEPEHFVAIFDNITASKQAEEVRRTMEIQLRQAQKLEAIGQLAAGIAHEINTPSQYVGDNTRFLQDAFKSLNAVLASHQQLLAVARQNALTPESLKQAEEILAACYLEDLREQIPSAITDTLDDVACITKIVRAMKEFSHPGGREKTAADLNRAIESTVTVARNEWKYVAETKLDLAHDLPSVPCFLSEFNQCILNLVVNAAHAIGDVVKKTPGSKGLITISTRRDHDWAEVRVADTGTGIAEQYRTHIFEPFFTTKDVGRGTGQGLTLVYGTIVKKHGGTVTFETEVGQGTTFILRLPISPQEPAPDTTSGAATTSPGQTV